jgi:hypothetical protein
MNLLDASRYIFQDRAWPRKAGKIAVVSAVPLLGQLWAMGYALRVLRGLLRGDEQLPDADLSTGLLWDGLRIMLVTFFVGIVVAVLGAPLVLADRAAAPGDAALVPALAQALRGPSALLITAVSATITAVVTIRLALTNSIERGLNPIELWALLRAEPAIWIASAAAGWIAFEGPYALVWALPLHGDLDVVATVLASSVAWTFGQLLNAHLCFQAYGWAKRTAALRAAGVRYRW